MPPEASKAEMKPDEEDISLSQVTDFKQQQKDMFTALLHQQQEDLKGFVQIIVDSTNSSLDAISRDIQKVKVSLRFTKKEVDDLKADSSKWTKRCDTMQADIYKVCDSLLTVTDKMEYLEGQTRRNHIVFDGVAESPGETWAKMEEKITKILAEKLQLQHKMEVERAHRTGKPSGGERPRPIGVKLLSHKDREAILQRATRTSQTLSDERGSESCQREGGHCLPALRQIGHSSTHQHTKTTVRYWTTDYKATKLHPNASSATTPSTDFPHRKEDITHAVLTTKFKAVRGKYRGAVDTGRRSGHGRVVLLYFEKCEQVWGGSPATTTLPTGVKTDDLEHSPRASCQASSTSDEIDASVVSEVDVEGDPDDGSVAPPVNERTALLNAKLRGHRQERLKKRLSAEAQQQNAIEEDQRIKRQLLNVIEASEKRAADNFSKVSNTLDRLTSSIVDGFSFLRDALHTPQPAQAPLPHYTTTLAQQGHRSSQHSHMPSQHSYLPNPMHQVFPQNSSGSGAHTRNIMPLNTINTADLSFRPFEGEGQLVHPSTFQDRLVKI
ncbi:hypothetical protein ABVT39_005164 [Epinephelus coioides]